MRRLYSRLSFQLMVLWSVSVAAVLGVMAGIFWYTMERYERIASEQTIANSFQYLADDVEAWKKSIRDSASRAAENEGIVDIMSFVTRYRDRSDYDPLIFDPEKRKLADLLATQSVGYSVRSVVLFDGEGSLTAYFEHTDLGPRAGFISYGASAEPQPIDTILPAVPHPKDGLEPWLLPLKDHTIDGPAPASSQSYELLDGLINYVVRRPILRPRETGAFERVGTVVAIGAMDEEFLGKLWQLEGVDTVFRLPDGTCLGRLTEVCFLDISTAPLLDRTAADLVFQKSAGHLFAARAISTVDGTAQFIVGVDNTAADSSISMLRDSVQWTLFGFFVLLLPVGTVFIRRNFRKPIRSLARRAEDIAKGTFEPIDARDDDELGRLAMAFNNMSDAIQLRENELAQSEKRFRSIIEVAPEAIITADGEGRILSFNKAAERVFGYREVDVTGQHFDLLIPPRFRAVHETHFRRFAASELTSMDMNSRPIVYGLRNCGAEFPTVASVSRTDINNQCIFTIMLRDITERKRLEDELRESHRNLEATLVELERSNQAKSEFLATMSHELRTPLNAILGFSEIMRHEQFGPIGDRYRSYASDINSSGQYLLELIDEVLDLASVEAGKKILNPQSFCLTNLLEECESIVLQIPKSSALSLNIEKPEPNIDLNVDRRVVKQIMLNLLSNAVRYTEKGGSVTLSVTEEPDGITFSISDTGCGIPPELLRKITEPFFQIGRTPYMAGEGWGLGLAIVKSLVDLLGGALDISSRVDQGTTVSVRLPREQVQCDPHYLPSRVVRISKSDWDCIEKPST